MTGVHDECFMSRSVLKGTSFKVIEFFPKNGFAVASVEYS